MTSTWTSRGRGHTVYQVHPREKAAANMSENMQTRTLFTYGPVSIVAEMHADEDTDPADRDFDDAEQKRDFLARYDAVDFEYVGMVVRVEWHGVTIGEDSLWGIEHGTVAEGIDADAWELIPSAYPAPGVVYMGSPLSGVVDTAIDSAATWLATLDGAGQALAVAAKWADPNARADA